jgi:hypothetical protein
MAAFITTAVTTSNLAWYYNINHCVGVFCTLYRTCEGIEPLWKAIYSKANFVLMLSLKYIILKVL